MACGGIVMAFLPSSVWTGSGLSKTTSHLPAAGVGIAAAGLALTGLAFWKGPRAAFPQLVILMMIASGLYFAVVEPKLSPDFAIARFCREANSRVPPEETIYVPAPDGATGIHHFYMRAPMPLRDGAPGYYLAAESQKERLERAGKKLEILDSMQDHRGRARYLLRILP